MGGGEKEENVQGKLIRTELIFEFLLAHESCWSGSHSHFLCSLGFFVSKNFSH